MEDKAEVKQKYSHITYKTNIAKRVVRLHLPLQANLVSPGFGGGGGYPDAARLQALMSIPLGCFEQPGNSGLHLWGGRDVKFFTLTVLPTHPTQVPILEKNFAI